MTDTRRVSLRALMRDLAADGVAVRLTLPDGTALETLTGTNLPASVNEDEDEAPFPHGHFAKKVRKS